MQHARFAAAVIALLPALGLGTVAQDQAATLLPPREPLPAGDLVAEGPARPGVQIDVPGRRSLWLGTETGQLEAWAYPLKVLRDLRLSFRFRDRTFRGQELAQRVEVRPEWTAITYAHPAFRVRQILAVPPERPATLMLLEVDASFPLTIEVSFDVELHPMWPAGLGGQYSYWDADLPGFALGEGSGAHSALIASPVATEPTINPAHSLPDQPTQFAIPIDPPQVADRVIPMVIATRTPGMDDPADGDELRALVRELLEDPHEPLRASAARARELEAGTVAVETPERNLDEAFRWAKVRLDQGLVCNPDLGCGLIAGYGRSGGGYRPGFAWFFGGDALYNSWALGAAGADSTVRTALEFLASYQRDDGKIMHELSQGAGSLAWFEDYPYGYYHAEGSPYFIDAIARHVRRTGDLEWARRMLPAVRQALEYSLSADTDGDGLMENTVAGLGAVEMGALREAEVHQDIYLASVWTRALDSLSWLARALGEEALASETATLHERARGSLDRLYWLPERGHHAFATTDTGGRIEQLTLWAGLPAALGQADPEHAARTVSKLAGPAITTDWGTRMLASTSPLYDPLIYNQGTVWPFLSGFAGMAAWRHGNPWAAKDLLDGLARLTRDHSRGAVHEVLSGDRYEPMVPSVPHQLFSSSSLVTPLIGGLFGLQVDAVAHHVTLAPRLPDDWPRAALRGVRVGPGELDFEIEQTARSLAVRARYGGEGHPPDLHLAPVLPYGATNVRAREPHVDGDPEAAGLPVEVERVPTGTRATVAAPWRQTATGERAASLEFDWNGGIRLTLETPRATTAGPSKALRVTSADWTDDGQLRVRVAGRPGSAYGLRVGSDAIDVLASPEELHGAPAAEGVKIEATGVGEWRLELAGEGSGYRGATLRLSPRPPMAERSR